MKTIAVFLCLVAQACAANFVQGSVGLSGSHGNSSNSNADQIGLVAPVYNLSSQCADTSTYASGTSLGASSNGVVVAVVYQTSSSGTLRVLDGGCNLLWQSLIFDTALATGAPMVGADGGVAANDDTMLVRFDPSGNVLWKTCYYTAIGGACSCADGTTLPSAHTGDSCPNVNVSDGFTLTPDGYFFVALHGVGAPGYFMYFNSSTGALLWQTYLNPTAGNASSYVANGKPCINGQTVFVATNRSDSTTLGRMYAISLSTSGLAVVWKWPATGSFNAPSRSPTCDNGALGSQGFVFTNGLDATSGYADFYGWNQSTGALIFDCLSVGGSCSTPITVPIVGNAALDPRSSPARSVWTSAPNAGYFYRISEVDGSILQKINTNLIPGDACSQGNPGSVPSIASNPLNGDALLISGLNSQACGARPAQAYVVVVDLATAQLQAYYLLPTGTGFLEGQFPIVFNVVTGLYEIVVTSTTGPMTLVAGFAGGSSGAASNGAVFQHQAILK